MDPRSNEVLSNVKIVAKPGSMLDRLSFNPNFPFLWRAQALGIARDLAFSLIAAAGTEVRRRNAIIVQQEAEREALAMAGAGALHAGDGLNTVDHFNEEQGATRGAAEDTAREDAGFAADMPPLELAARLKLIRDWLASELYHRAGLRTNWADAHRTRERDPFHCAPPLSQEIERQANRGTTVVEADVEEQARLLGVPAKTLARVKSNQRAGGVRFVRENYHDILSLVEGLMVVRPRDPATDSDVNKSEYVDFYDVSEASAEQVELTLPAIHRARMFVAADRGLMWESDRQVQQMLKKVPEAKGNYYMIVAQRIDIKMAFDRFMKREDIAREIQEAVERGATYPTLEALTAEEIKGHYERLDAENLLRQRAARAEADDILRQQRTA